MINRSSPLTSSGVFLRWITIFIWLNFHPFWDQPQYFTFHPLLLYLCFKPWSHISFSYHFYKYLPHLHILVFKNTLRGFNQKKYWCRLDIFTFFLLPSHEKTNTFHAEINQIQQTFDSSVLASSFTASSITNKSWWLVRHWRIDMAVCQ